jgi:ketosteroid isomerase-like protein
MKRSACLVLLLCVGVRLARAQEADDARSKVLALERLWGEAAQFRDINALDSILDDSLMYVHIDGRRMTKAEVLADTKLVSAVAVVVKSQVAHVHGNTVVVTGVLQLQGIERGKPYLQHGRFVDTWINKGGRWVCISSMTTPVQAH